MPVAQAAAHTSLLGGCRGRSCCCCNSRQALELLPHRQQSMPRQGLHGLLLHYVGLKSAALLQLESLLRVCNIFVFVDQQLLQPDAFASDCHTNSNRVIIHGCKNCNSECSFVVTHYSLLLFVLL